MDQKTALLFKNKVCKLRVGKLRLVALVSDVTDDCIVVTTDRQSAFRLFDVASIEELPQWQDYEFRAKWNKQRKLEEGK